MKKADGERKGKKVPEATAKKDATNVKSADKNTKPTLSKEEQIEQQKKLQKMEDFLTTLKKNKKNSDNVETKQP